MFPSAVDEMIRRAAITLIGLFIFQIGWSQNALHIPDTLTGTTIHLSLQNGTRQFFGGPLTHTMGANGSVLGPTLILNKGDTVSFQVDNQLADTTTTHWHGMHVSAVNDGGPHTPIPPNTTWSPRFEILDKAGTYWYHPHLHHLTDKHVSKGIAGLIIVRDKEEAALALPRTYGLDDFPLVIQTKDFDLSNQIVVHSNSDDVVLTNATINPFLTVPAQFIRCRVLNGSSQRVFNLGLSNGQSFYQIASDGGLLSSPVQLTRLLLAPGERAELLIDFTGMNGRTVFLKSYASELPNGIYGAANPGMGPRMTMTGYKPNPLNGADFDILEFRVGAQTSNPVASLPSNLASLRPIAANSADLTRRLTFTPVSMGPNQLNGAFLINGQSMDLNVINYTIPFNNTEIWELTNQSAIAHPFHIHDVQFYVLTRNGVAPALNEQGRKDVVLVRPQETVRFITRFETFANDTVPYMYHCHMLTHEDDGMMGQFVVSSSLSVSEHSTEDKRVSIFPNPSLGKVIMNFDEVPSGIVVYDARGREIRSIQEIDGAQVILENLPAGMNYVSLTFEKEVLVKTIVVN